MEIVHRILSLFLTLAFYHVGYLVLSNWIILTRKKNTNEKCMWFRWRNNWSQQIHIWALRPTSSPRFRLAWGLLSFFFPLLNKSLLASLQPWRFTWASHRRNYKEQKNKWKKCGFKLWFNCQCPKLTAQHTAEPPRCFNWWIHTQVSSLVSITWTYVFYWYSVWR